MENIKQSEGINTDIVVINPEQSIDLETEKLKEKIKEILDFPIHDIDFDRDGPDPRAFFDSNPSKDEIAQFYEKHSHIEKVSNVDLSELCFVIIGEQPATDKTFYFDDEQGLDNFVSLVKETGIIVEVAEKAELNNKVGARFLFGKTQESLDKLREVLAIGDSGDYKKYHREYGKLMGFPDTAISAFMEDSERFDGDVKKSEEIKEIRAKHADLPQKLYGNFVFSKNHFAEEYEAFLKRNENLRGYAPQLFT